MGRWCINHYRSNWNISAMTPAVEMDEVYKSDNVKPLSLQYDQRLGSFEVSAGYVPNIIG